MVKEKIMEENAHLKFSQISPKANFIICPLTKAWLVINKLYSLKHPSLIIRTSKASQHSRKTTRRCWSTLRNSDNRPFILAWLRQFPSAMPLGFNSYNSPFIFWPTPGTKPAVFTCDFPLDIHGFRSSIYYLRRAWEPTTTIIRVSMAWRA